MSCSVTFSKEILNYKFSINNLETQIKESDVNPNPVRTGND